MHDDHVAYRYHKRSRANHSMPKTMGRNWWKVDERCSTALDRFVVTYYITVLQTVLRQDGILPRYPLSKVLNGRPSEIQR